MLVCEIAVTVTCQFFAAVSCEQIRVLVKHSPIRLTVEYAVILSD